MVSGLIFRSLTHFELIFVISHKEQYNFILFHLVFQFSKHHLLKRLSFLHCMFLASWLKIICPYICGFISGVSILSHWSVCLFFCQYHAVFFFNCCSCTVVSIFTRPCPLPHPSLPPTLEPIPFGFAHVSFTHVPWWPLSPHYFSLPSSLVTVSLLFISMSLAVLCLLVCFVD